MRNNLSLFLKVRWTPNQPC